MFSGACVGVRALAGAGLLLLVIMLVGGAIYEVMFKIVLPWLSNIYKVSF